MGLCLTGSHINSIKLISHTHTIKFTYNYICNNHLKTFTILTNYDLQMFMIYIIKIILCHEKATYTLLILIS